MWAGVRQRFRQLHENLKLTSGQIDEGNSHHHGVRKALNSHYCGNASETNNSFLTGSWGKFTSARPPRDIDVYFVLPYAVYQRFEGHTGNRQSQLLQEVRSVLQSTYSSTQIKGDGPVVIVGFNRMSVEVVPAFALDGGKYWICDTKNGGRYMAADPKAEIDHVAAVNRDCNNNLRPMVMMLKAWQSHCNVPMKSFFLELVTAEFLQNYGFRMYDYYWYDWFFRDFFKFLIDKANGYVWVPGTYEPIFLGDAWKSRAETAHNRALEACASEHDDYVVLAGEEWQKIFGGQIPMNPL